MATNVQLLHQHSLMLWLALLLTWLHLTSAMTVHLNYTIPAVKDGPMPDELNVTLNGESGAPTYLRLRIIQHFDINLPVYSLRVDENGGYSKHLEQLEDKMNIGYYQDVSSEAVVQVTRIDNGPGDNDSYFELKGELNIGGHKFILSPEGRFKRDAPSSSPSEDAQYSLLPQDPSLVDAHDYILAQPEVQLRVVESPHPKIQGLLPPVPARNTSSLSETRRRRRQSGTATPVFIDIVAVIDNAAHRRFRASSASSTATLQAIREYYSFIFSAVDLRYQGITNAQYPIRIRLTKLIVAETTATSTFTEQFRQSSTPWDETDANSSLGAFSVFAAGSGGSVLLPYDHAVLITGYDLTTKKPNGDISDSITGLAYLSTMCRTDGKSTSIVEDLGGFQSVDTVAHELGHSFSAVHDGEGNNCRAEDRFIMSAGGYQQTPSNKLNPWFFSSCSITNIMNYINRTLKTTPGSKCMSEKLSISGVPDIGNRLPGQEFSPDNQCRMIYGNASRLCRGDDFATPPNICTSMFCLDPSNQGLCYGLKAAMGTTCGNGKICLSGKCVADSRAPAVDDNCVFGDQPGIAFDNKTCPEFVNGFNFYCNQSVVRGACCQSCKAVYRNVPGCEYGDTAQGCTANHCRFPGPDTLRQCCRTCGVRSAPPASPTIITNPTVSPSSLSTSRMIVGQQISTTITTACVDNPNILVNGQSCGSAIISNPSFCSNRVVKESCCASCRRARANPRG